MARKAKLDPAHAGTMSLPKAMLTGAGIVVTGLLVAMLVPLAHDIYGTAKNWLLKDGQPPIQ